jgi:hypothetical protein
VSATSAPSQATVTQDAAIRPFKIDFPQDAIDDLRRRIAATRWPDKETVADASQGVQLATMQALARYWGADYDFRRLETTLNALPQFLTEVSFSPRSMGWTSISSTFARATRARSRSSSPTGGRGRSSSS